MFPKNVEGGKSAMLGIALLLLPSLALASSATQVKLASASGTRDVSEPLPKGMPVKQLMPWYKTGDEIHDALQQLSKDCKGAEVDFTTEAISGSAGLDVFRVFRLGSKPKTKAMLVFGEHARELISPESGLNFAQTLCGQGATDQAQHADSVLNDVEFILVPNANPIARKEVEAGSYCKRTNEDGVDLNRNWDDKYVDQSFVGSGDETDPGPHGFSEMETELLKGLVDSHRPDIYLSVHSGAFLLGEPYGYTMSRVPKEVTTMTEVLQPISAKYCNGQCPYGNLAKIIEYANGGCDIDYVYEKLNTPFVFTWEIYTGERFRDGYIDKAAALNAKGGSFLQRTSGKMMLQSGEQMPESDESVQDCIDQFLPKTEVDTQAVVNNWSGAYLELCDEVVKKRGLTSD